MRESGADIDNTTIIGVGVIGALLIAVSIVLVQALFGSFDRADARRKRGASADLVRYQAEQRDKLDRYRWVDSKRGVVAIPIERSIELTAERGLPTPAPSAPPRTTPPEG